MSPLYIEIPSFVKAAGGIDFQHAESHRKARLVRLIQELLDPSRSDASILLLGSDFDGSKKNLITRALDAHVSNRRTWHSMI
jgi:hypothetical protein